MLRNIVFILIVIVSLSYAGTSFTALPIFFSSPDTGLGLGAKTEYRTTITGNNFINYSVMAYETQMKQSALGLGFDTRYERYRIIGSLGFFNDLNYFYGIGPDSHWRNQEKYSETTAQASLSVLVTLNENTFIGPILDERRYRPTEFEKDKTLQTKTVPGSNGFLANGIGGQIIIDQRDQDLSPHQGSYFQVKAINYGKLTSTDYQFLKTFLDYRVYTDLGEDHVLASQVYATSSTGEEIPFQLLPAVGGDVLRGYYAQRWIDRNSFLIQTEYRKPLTTDVVGAVFVGAGQVAYNFQEMKFGQMETSFGAVLRYWLNKAERICVRLDVTYAQGDRAFYLDIHEAF